MNARQAASMDGFFMTSGKSAKAEMDRIAAVFNGRTDEVSKHGKITCKKTAGLITSLSGVTLPNGKLTVDIKRGVPETGLWRVKEEDGSWTYGKLEFSKKDVTFIPDTVTVEVQPFIATSLPFHLINSTNACNLVRDNRTAIYLYGALASASWKMSGSGRKWECNWIQAAQAITQMRGLNEPYSVPLLEYESERQGCEEDEFIVDILHGLGWEFDAYPDMQASHKRAETLVDEHEKREAGDTPDWYAHYITALRPHDNDLISRLNRAAFTGRIPYKQWCLFWKNYDFDSE
jgi:hypothetical protein